MFVFSFRCNHDTAWCAFLFRWYRSRRGQSGPTLIVQEGGLSTHQANLCLQPSSSNATPDPSRWKPLAVFASLFSRRASSCLADEPSSALKLHSIRAKSDLSSAFQPLHMRVQNRRRPRRTSTFRYMCILTSPFSTEQANSRPS